MLVFPCHVCRTSLSATESQSGQLVRCPTCLTTLRVPQRQAAPVGVPEAPDAMDDAPVPPPPRFPGQFRVPPMTGSAGGGKPFGFNCGYCSSRLEATDATAGQDGQCPTCGNNITIPLRDRYGRLIDPRSGQIIKQDPHPVHAYAAAGDRAPGILRHPDGSQSIQCAKCASFNVITANNCRNCGMPFTMEGTAPQTASASNGFCVASLVLGIISIPAACAIIPSVLAIVFGIIGYVQTSRSESARAGRGLAIAGIVCGAIGAFLGVMWIGSV